MKRLLLLLLPITLLFFCGCMTANKQLEMQCDSMAKVYCGGYDLYDIEVKCIMEAYPVCAKYSCMIACQDVMLMWEFDFDGKQR